MMVMIKVMIKVISDGGTSDVDGIDQISISIDDDEDR
jgi:hypothetical protein